MNRELEREGKGEEREREKNTYCMKSSLLCLIFSDNVSIFLEKNLHVIFQIQFGANMEGSSSFAVYFLDIKILVNHCLPSFEALFSQKSLKRSGEFFKILGHIFSFVQVHDL